MALNTDASAETERDRTIEMPDEIPTYLAEGMEKQSPETLRLISHVAQELAGQKERAAERELEEQAVDEEELPEGENPEEWAREDAPRGASLTTKHINGNDYYYWQWRDGQHIKSEYVRPVNPSREE